MTKYEQNRNRTISFDVTTIWFYVGPFGEDLRLLGTILGGACVVIDAFDASDIERQENI